MHSLVLVNQNQFGIVAQELGWKPGYLSSRHESQLVDFGLVPLSFSAWLTSDICGCGEEAGGLNMFVKKTFLPKTRPAPW